MGGPKRFHSNTLWGMLLASRTAASDKKQVKCLSLLVYQRRGWLVALRILTVDKILV